MVYESDFYTTRRPYRSTPAYSTYSVSSAPSRQIRVLPGLGKVHIVHTYDRIVPYIGHKRLTVVTSPPKIYATRPSVLQREYDWIENKLRPWVAYSPTNRYLSSKSAVIFDDETRLIRAKTASLLKQIHLPVPRTRSWGITPLNRYGEFPSLPVKYSNDTYIHKLLTVGPNSKIHYATYYTEPIKKYIGQGHLSCVSYAGDKSYSRRRPLTIYEDALRNDIQLLSYYINKFRQEKSQPKDIQAPLPANRPSRIFSVHKPIEDPVAAEIKDLREARAARLAKIYDTDEKTFSDVEKSVKTKRQREEAQLAEEKAIIEEQARKEALAKKEESAKKAELARQKQLAAQIAAEQAEKARQQELEKQAEAARARQIEEERIQREEQQRLEAEAREEEERKQLLRLEEIARQAEEEKEAELARQAEELAELARQEAELLELERQVEEQKKKEAELAEIALKEAEAKLEQEKREAELAELERQEAELAELARQEAELAELERQEAELAALERQEAELAALVTEKEDPGELEKEIPDDSAETTQQDVDIIEKKTEVPTFDDNQTDNGIESEKINEKDEIQNQIIQETPSNKEQNFEETFEVQEEENSNVFEE